MKIRVDDWVLVMQQEFYNLEDGCCPMGKSLKPIENLCRAVDIIAYYRGELERIMNKGGELIVKEGKSSEEIERLRGEREGKDECAAIAEAALDRRFF